jgi:low temperature requirement protein LtrA
VTEYHHIDLDLLIVAILGTSIAIGLWWIYFDFISHRLPKKGMFNYSFWMYMHLPMTMGIAATGASILNVIEHMEESLPIEGRWILISSVAIVLICVAFLGNVIVLDKNLRGSTKMMSKVLLIAALVVIGLGFFEIGSIPLFLILAVILLIPVFFGFMIWLRAAEKEHLLEEVD